MTLQFGELVWLHCFLNENVEKQTKKVEKMFENIISFIIFYMKKYSLSRIRENLLIILLFLVQFSYLSVFNAMIKTCVILINEAYMGQYFFCLRV